MYKEMLTEKLKNTIKNAMKLWKYNYDYNKSFRNESCEVAKFSNCHFHNKCILSQDLQINVTVFS